tara:strand:+ start:7742 stop:9034 length:1293 start_codon:yes stop_codon:yes gene_type:complete
MSKQQVANYFGLSKRETDETVDDLVARGEMTLSKDGRLTLTDKSKDYFPDIGEVPQLPVTQESSATLCFDLATFSCFSNQNVRDKWRAGVSLRIDDSSVANSEKLAEKHFQQQFSQILDKGYLPSHIVQQGSEQPTVYTVKSVNKLRQLPLRLTSEFQIDTEGKPVERDDYEELINSECIHELIATELSALTKGNNLMSITKSMSTIGDENTLKLFDSKTNAFTPGYMSDMLALEEHNQSGRLTLLGPIYSQSNWAAFNKLLGPILVNRIKEKVDNSNSRFTWVAPSDPFWAKSERFVSSLSDLINKASTKDKILYKPVIYLPVGDKTDFRAAKQWINEFREYKDSIKCLAEGFLDGNVEVILLEDELVVVIYHFVQPETLPVSMPIGFISTDKKLVTKLGKLVSDYVEGMSSFDNPNDCGYIDTVVNNS